MQHSNINFYILFNFTVELITYSNIFQWDFCRSLHTVINYITNLQHIMLIANWKGPQKKHKSCRARPIREQCHFWGVLRAWPMKMLHQRHGNGLDYCSRNGNGAVKEQKHPVALVPQKYITVTSKTCCHRATKLQLQYCNKMPHFDRNSNRN